MGDLPSQHEQEVMMAELKQKLEAWREVVIPFRSILMWKNPWHTIILLSFVSFIFLMIWWCDLSVISSFSILGAVITLADYIGPIAIKTLSDPSNWTSKQEKTFDDICRSLVYSKLRCANMIHWVYGLKANQPLLYYVGALMTLILLAFFGQVVNNLLLTYLLVIFNLLLPGLWQNDPMKSCLSFIGGFMSKATGKSSTDKKGKLKGN